MAFKERLKTARVDAGLTQVELAQKIGVTARTIQNYELGGRRPKNYTTVEQLAKALGVLPSSLLASVDGYLIDAAEKGGSRAVRDINELVSEVSGLFAGGELSEDAIEGAMKALTEAYWIAKERNKKYTPQKYICNATSADNP